MCIRDSYATDHATSLIDLNAATLAALTSRPRQARREPMFVQMCIRDRINRHPNAETLIDIAKLAEYTVRFFNQTPVMGMLSYSNFGADKEGSPVSVHEAVDYMQQNYPCLLYTSRCV